MHVSVHVYLCVSVCMCLCVSVSAGVSANVCLCIFVSMHVYICDVPNIKFVSFYVSQKVQNVKMVSMCASVCPFSCVYRSVFCVCDVPNIKLVSLECKVFKNS